MIALIIVLGIGAICLGVLFIIACWGNKCSDNSMAGRMAARTAREAEQKLFVYLTGIILFIASFFFLPFLAGLSIWLESSGIIKL